MATSKDNIILNDILNKLFSSISNKNKDSIKGTSNNQLSRTLF